MNKLFALLRNELTKLRHRKILLIFAVLMLVWSLGVALLINSFGVDVTQRVQTAETILSRVELERTEGRASLKRLEQLLDDTAYEPSRSDIETYGQIRSELDKQDWIAANVDLYRNTPQIDSILSAFYDVKAKIYTFEKLPPSQKGLQDTIAEGALRVMVDKIEPTFLKGDLNGLVEMIWQARKMTAAGDETEQARYDKIMTMQKRYLENGADFSSAVQFGFEYETALAALDGRDATAGMRFPSERKTVEDTVKVLEKKAESGIVTAGNSFGPNMIYRVMTTFSAFFIGLLVIVIAGGMISSEMSSGSIKSLILAPVRRYKILTAKLIACFGVLLLFSVYAWAINTAIVTFVNGGSLSGYVGVAGNTAYALRPALYGLAQSLLQNVGSLFFMLLAFTLSTVGLGTAGAVGISMGIRFGAVSLLNILFLALKPAEWMKYMPFHHLELVDRVFPKLGQIEQLAARGMALAFGGGGSAPETTLSFSLLWIGWLMFLMLLAAYDSFLRRDI